MAIRRGMTLSGEILIGELAGRWGMIRFGAIQPTIGEGMGVTPIIITDGITHITMVTLLITIITVMLVRQRQGIWVRHAHQDVIQVLQAL